MNLLKKNVALFIDITIESIDNWTVILPKIGAGLFWTILFLQFFKIRFRFFILIYILMLNDHLFLLSVLIFILFDFKIFVVQKILFI